MNTPNTNSTHLAVASAVGCRSSSVSSATESPQLTARQLHQVQQPTNAAAQGMKDYASAEKAGLAANLEVRLTEINRDLDQLAARVEKANHCLLRALSIS
jgi:hypothetical protein